MSPGLLIARSVIMPEGGVETWAHTLAALNALALALLVACTVAWGRHGRWRPVVSGWLLVLVAASTYLALVRPSDIPVGWITILHESLERKSIMHLYARGVHAGANFIFLESVAGGPTPTLHDVVWMNLLLALVNAAIFLHLAIDVAGPAWGVFWTLVFALNPATFEASFSELPTNVLALYFLAGVIGWVVATDPRRQPRLIRAAAYLLCAVLTILVTLTRSEIALIGFVALGVAVGHAVLGTARWPIRPDGLRTVALRALAFLDAHPVAVAALCLAGGVLSSTGLAGLPWGLSGREPVAGVYPFNPSVLSLYAFLPMLALPIGVGVAVFFGSVYAVVHFRRAGGLALSLLILVRAYFAAENEYHEMVRYISYILPAVFLLGLFGKAMLETLARRWSPTVWRAARISYVATWCTLPLPGTLQFFSPPEVRREGGFSQFLLDLNTQREVRHLIELTEKNPECVFIGRVVADDRSDFKVAPEYELMVFGAALAQPIQVPEKSARIDEVIARYAGDASCVRLYFGGDCNLGFTDHCAQFVSGHRLIDEVRFWSRPYNNPREMGYGAPEIVLATYEWR